MRPCRLVVVGASLAGVRTVEALRRNGFDGRLTLLGDEPHLPYDRPPLSKEVLRGHVDPAATELRNAQDLHRLGVQLRLGERADHLDLPARQLYTDRGATVGFDELVVATGSVARTLPGADLPGAHTLRTRDDAIRLRASLTRVERPRVVVVGARFLGGEIAASCRTLGLDVTLLEPGAQLLAGYGPAISSIYAQLHRDNGVAVHCGRRAVGVVGEERARGVLLDDGDIVPGDVVVLAIGSRPATSWLEGSGVTLDDGIVCDASLRAAERVHAAGDVARWWSSRYGQLQRVEHWTNAVEQARTVALDIVTGRAAHDSIPYAWSDQYGSRLQAAGTFASASLARGRPIPGSETSAIGIVGTPGSVTGVAALDATPRFLRLRALLGQTSDWAAFEAAISDLTPSHSH
jgi:NADPH-dependent 2,4-dienoyl-CoA reductase/sulfur reductase-like enzyme